MKNQNQIQPKTSRRWFLATLAGLCGICPLLGEMIRPEEKSEAASSRRSVSLRLQLIWGTDSQKPAGSPYKEVGPDLQKRFRRVFKWKHYYEITSKHAELKPGQRVTVRMSKKCVLRLRQTSNHMLEVVLIGEGRITKKVRSPLQPLEKGELLVLAGEDTSNFQDAWFVVVSIPQKEKNTKS